MTYAITQTCCNDATCVAVCPVNCIHPAPGEPDFGTTEMLYIDPKTCIDCGACADACPVDAIFPADRLTGRLREYEAINAEYYADRAPAPALASPNFHTWGEPSFPRSLPADFAPLRIAVVGTGPAGMYAAEDLLLHTNAEVTLIDRLPVAGGLLRYGVAPDHPATKGASETFARFHSTPGPDAARRGDRRGRHRRGTRRAPRRGDLRRGRTRRPAARHPRRGAARQRLGDLGRVLVQRASRDRRGRRPALRRTGRRRRQRQRRPRRRPRPRHGPGRPRRHGHRRPRPDGPARQPGPRGGAARPPGPRGRGVHGLGTARPEAPARCGPGRRRPGSAHRRGRGRGGGRGQGRAAAGRAPGDGGLDGSSPVGPAPDRAPFPLRPRRGARHRRRTGGPGDGGRIARRYGDRGGAPRAGDRLPGRSAGGAALRRGHRHGAARGRAGDGAARRVRRRLDQARALRGHRRQPGLRRGDGRDPARGRGRRCIAGSDGHGPGLPSAGQEPQSAPRRRTRSRGHRPDRAGQGQGRGASRVKLATVPELVAAAKGGRWRRQG